MTKAGQFQTRLFRRPQATLACVTFASVSEACSHHCKLDDRPQHQIHSKVVRYPMFLLPPGKQ